MGLPVPDSTVHASTWRHRRPLCGSAGSLSLAVGSLLRILLLFFVVETEEETEGTRSLGNVYPVDIPYRTAQICVLLYTVRAVFYRSILFKSLQDITESQSFSLSCYQP